MTQLEPLHVVEDVQRARDPEAAWLGFGRRLAGAGFEQVACYFGVPCSVPFPSVADTRFWRGLGLPDGFVEIFARHPEYTRRNPIVRHCRSSPHPLLRAGEDPSVPFAPAHLRMLSTLRDLLGDVDLNIFPLSNPLAREYGNFTVYTPRTRAGRRHVRELRDALHLAGLYFHAAMQSRFPSPSGTRAPVVLSPRQVECLTWVAGGLTSKEIAARLGLSRKTVDLHLAVAMQKLEAGSRAQAAARAIALGLVQP